MSTRPSWGTAYIIPRQAMNPSAPIPGLIQRPYVQAAQDGRQTAIMMQRAHLSIPSPQCHPLSSISHPPPYLHPYTPTQARLERDSSVGRNRSLVSKSTSVTVTATSSDPTPTIKTHPSSSAVDLQLNQKGADDVVTEAICPSESELLCGSTVVSLNSHDHSSNCSPASATTHNTAETYKPSHQPHKQGHGNEASSTQHNAYKISTPYDFQDKIHAAHAHQKDVNPSPRSSGPTVVRRGRWMDYEDKMLYEAVQKYGASEWELISKHVKGRTIVQCRNRWVFWKRWTFRSTVQKASDQSTKFMTFLLDPDSQTMELQTHFPEPTPAQFYPVVPYSTEMTKPSSKAPASPSSPPMAPTSLSTAAQVLVSLDKSLPSVSETSDQLSTPSTTELNTLDDHHQHASAASAQGKGSNDLSLNSASVGVLSTQAPSPHQQRHPQKRKLDHEIDNQSPTSEENPTSPSKLHFMTISKLVD